MRKIIITFIFFAIIATAKQTFAQAPEWIWAQSAGGTTQDGGTSISTVVGGNIYVTGYFRADTLTFGSITLTNTSVYKDIFIAKYDTDGNVLWAKSAGGFVDDIPLSASADEEGNIYIAGYFRSSPIIFDSISLTNLGPGEDIFIAKYDSNGNVLWARNAGGTGDERAYSISSDPEGNAYLSGWFNSSSASFGSTTLTNTGGADMFIAKYDGDGNVLWAENAPGTSTEWATTVSADTAGNAYVSGLLVQA